MHDSLIRRLASDGKVKSAATRGPAVSWLGSASQAGAFSGFQYLTPPERIANRVVADEYAEVSAQIDALYGQPPQLPADYESAGMARLRREATARMLSNGLCTRPAELDCRMESACETCAYFRTGTQFLPVLVRQRDHARDHGQTERAALFDGLIDTAAQEGDPAR
jgi:hypothetical protein